MARVCVNLCFLTDKAGNSDESLRVSIGSRSTVHWAEREKYRDDCSIARSDGKCGETLRFIVDRTLVEKSCAIFGAFYKLQIKLETFDSNRSVVDLEND